MEESKSVLTDRLRTEGRWEEASRFKDEKIAELRKSSMTRKDAGAAAWEAMAEKYPPLPPDQQLCTCHVPQLSNDDVGEIYGRTEGEALAPDVSRDATWVYDNMDVVDVRLVFAPSTGAWGLLHWARKNRSEFYEKYWLKHAPKPEPPKDTSDCPQPDPDVVFRIVDGILETQERSYIKDMPTEVIFDVEQRFYAWERRHKLHLPREARKDLEEQMVGVACVVRQAFQGAALESGDGKSSELVDDVSEKASGGPTDL